MRSFGAVALLLVVLTVGTVLSAQTDATPHPAKDVVERFEKALEQRDLATIEKLMDPAMVAFENGHRNDSWADFRDHHLKPEMQEPAPAMERKLMSFTAGEDLAWAYTRATFTSARGRAYQLWSIYVLGKRSDGWKIVMLDWSMRALPASPAAPAKGATTSWTLEAVEAKLKAAGLSVRRDVRVEQPFLKAPGVVLVVGKDGAAEIQTYIYPNVEARAADTSQLDPKKAAPPTVSPHWLMPVSLIAEGNLAAIVLTRDPSLAEQIRAALAKPSP